MATNNNDPEIKMPDVGTPAPHRAGAWAVWFVIILAIACVIAFLV